MFALHYTSVKTPTETNKVFGLQVAVLDWVRAWFRYGAQEKFPVLIGDIAGQQEIDEIAAAVGLDPKRLSLLDQRHARENFPQFDVIFRADPDPVNLLWQRQLLTGRSFAFCGLTHAISGVEGGRVFEQFCLAPSVETDAIICPSNAVASAIRAFWDNYADFLRMRFRTNYQCLVQLPVIPLGVDTDKIAARITPDKRAAQRTALGVGENDAVLLWVGRLSHAIKAHPLVMFQAAERAAEKLGTPVHLVMQGYFVPKEADEQFTKLAQDVCRTAKVTFVAPNDKRFPDGLWAAGDIFLSLIDNMQESFGLTPIEAMAAGLPRIVSDWDGYRDCVQNGEDGFLIRTMTPPPGNGAALSELLLNGKEMYGGFLAKTALSTAVDVDLATAAIILLINDKNMRRDMAEKARQRARNVYDWRHIIPAYETLWKDLAARRPDSHGNQAWPTVPDPFTMYAGYPSATLKESDKVQLGMTMDSVRALLAHDINVFGVDIMIPPEEVPALIVFIGTKESFSISEIFAQFPAADRPALWRTITWLIKMGILRLSGSNGL